MPKSIAIAAFVALFLGALVPTVAFGRSPSGGPLASAPGFMVPVYAGSSHDTYSPVPAPTSELRNGSNVVNTLTPTSTIQVTYTGFSAQAKIAFQAAVDVWQSIIVSDKVIHVDAHWSPLGTVSGILGQAGPRNIYLEGDGYWYPGPLEEARCHCNRDTGKEIQATFNSQFPSWYLGTDGHPPNNKWDLETVVLHELGHGLGFLSSFNVTGNSGSWGFDGHPLRFDANEWSALTGGQQMITFADGSTALKTQLTDNSVYLGGSHVVAALGKRARLFAPSGWQSGSSNSHLDETEYAPGTINALMTPVLNNGESIHAPGPAVVAIFEDIGWSVAGSGTVPDAPLGVSATAGDTAAHVSWSAPSSNGGSNITGYDVTSAPGGETCATGGGTSCTVNGLTNGVQYTFTVTATNGVGTGPASNESNAVVPHAPSTDVTGPVAAAPEINIVAPQQMGTNQSIRVSWPDAVDTSGIAAYQLQMQQGAAAFTSVTLATPTSTSAQVTVTRGVSYAFRVRATDGVGNVGSWTATASASMTTLQETDGSIVYASSWTQSALSGSAGGHVLQSSVTDDTATFTFTGTSVALVSTLAKGRGIAAITLDGGAAELVDLYSAAKHAKRVVWTPDLPLTPGTHTVVVRITGTKNASATSTRVDIDAFLVWP